MSDEIVKQGESRTNAGTLAAGVTGAVALTLCCGGRADCGRTRSRCSCGISCQSMVPVPRCPHHRRSRLLVSEFRPTHRRSESDRVAS